jgi:cation transport ATPase
MEQEESISSAILGNLPTVIGVIGMFIIASLYWMDPGWPFAVTLRNSVTLSLPWPTAIVSLLLIRRHVRNIMRQESTVPYDVITVGSALVMIILGLVNGTGDPTRATLYANINIIGTMAVISAIAISIFSPMIRIYRAKSWTMAFLIGLSILAFMTYSPLGQMIHPVIPQAGDFVQTYISGASDSAFWISTYIGAIALVTRMILLKERLKPT